MVRKMGRRNGFEIGRFAAAMLAVILASVIPVRSMISSRIDEISSSIVLHLDEFTSGAKRCGGIRVADYEDLLSFLGCLQSGFGLDIWVEQEAESVIFVSGSDELSNTGDREEPGSPASGQYIHIPNDDIVACIYDEGAYSLYPGDILNITVHLNGDDMLSILRQWFLIPDMIAGSYSSGIVI